MNTLAVLIGAGALVWIAFEAFDTWGEPLLGVIAIGGILLMLALAPFAYDEDRRIIMGIRQGRED